MKGEKKLGQLGVEKTIRALCFDEDQASAFRLLVAANQSPVTETKEALFKDLDLFTSQTGKEIPESDMDYFLFWYLPIVRELVCSSHFKGNYAKLAAAVVPSISVEQVKRGVEFLLKLGMIKKLSAGRFKVSEKVLSTHPKSRHQILQAYQLEMMELARRALGESSNRDPVSLKPHSEKKQFSSTTIGIPVKLLDEIQNKLRKLRREILTKAAQSPETDLVVQLNIQLFPVGEWNASHAK